MALSDPPPPGTEWLVKDLAVTAGRLRDRRETTVIDLFLPAGGRLRDDDRLAVAHLLANLIDAVEHDLRRRLVPIIDARSMVAQALASPRIAIVRPILERTNLLRDPAVIAVLKRRGHEARIVATLRHAAARLHEIDPLAPGSPIERMADGDGPAAAAARRMLRMEHARFDASGLPLLSATELPADLQHRLVWRIAAALREYVVNSQTAAPPAIDPLIASIVAAALAGYDEGEMSSAVQTALARALLQQGELDDALIVDALAAGHVGFTVAGLALRAGIGFDAGWDMALDDDGGGLLLLCRAAGVGIHRAASLAVQLGGTDDDEVLARRVEGYGAIPPQRAEAAVAVWRLDPVYLESIADLAARRPT